MNDAPSHETRAQAMIVQSLDTFQKRVDEWMQVTFGTKESARQVTERADRFLEEALELYQAAGNSKQSALQLVDYVFGRPVGEPVDEIAGTLVTLFALATPLNANVANAAELALIKCWRNVEKIRAKDAAKPSFSPLPGQVL